MSFSISPISNSVAFTGQQNPQQLIQELIKGIQSGDSSTKLKQIFDALPSEIQKAICFKHWQNCGSPTRENALSKMAHDNFGEVSLLGTEERCNVSVEKKVATLTAYLSSLSGNQVQQQGVQVVQGKPLLSEYKTLQEKIKVLAEGLIQEYNTQKETPTSSALMEKYRKE